MYEQHFLASIALYRLHQGAARPRPRIDLQPSSFMMEALPRSTAVIVDDIPTFLEKFK